VGEGEKEGEWLSVIVSLPKIEMHAIGRNGSPI
jgi:hypothetical protein